MTVTTMDRRRVERTQEKTFDALVIGAGFTGLSAGLELVKEGELEARQLEAFADLYLRKWNVRLDPETEIIEGDSAFTGGDKESEPDGWAFLTHLDTGVNPGPRLPRVRGQYQHRIHYRHVIDWLVRKPGAFARYVYREEMFPTLVFRRAYDAISAPQPGTKADLEYLRILHLAAKRGDARADLAEVVARVERRAHGDGVAEDVHFGDHSGTDRHSPPALIEKRILVRSDSHEIEGLSCALVGHRVGRDLRRRHRALHPRHPARAQLTLRPSHRGTRDV
mgnify:CR=1 FL=1